MVYNIKFPQIKSMQDQSIRFIENDIQSLLYLMPEPESIQHLSILNVEPESHIQLPPLDFQDLANLDHSHLSPPSPNDASLQDSDNSIEKSHNSSKQSVPKKKKLKKRRKSLIDDNSPFHNCQKHLIKALKAIIIIPSEECEEEREVRNLAEDIWKAFKSNQAKTKRVLNAVFNEAKEIKLNEEELESYGLSKLHQTHGSQAYNAAKNYLSKLAVDQLDNFNVSCYVNSTKIKDKNNFKQYIQCFRHELRQGSLPKRVLVMVH